MNAPVVIFAYNRSDHLKQTLTALANNFLAQESEVYIFIDGPKNEEGEVLQQEVEGVANSFSHGYFAAVNIIKSDKNRGLAASVISGVDTVIRKYGKVIVLEDDSVSDCRYLQFMNDALDFYKDEENIWSVGGYMHAMKFPENYTKNVLCVQRTSSMAWGTWLDRWEQIDWDIQDYKKFRWSFKKRKEFNRWGTDKASMLDDQMNGRINSWAIRFEYAMFKKRMYNILPRESLIRNIGFDGSGTHCAMVSEDENSFAIELTDAQKKIQIEIVKPEESIRKIFCEPFNVRFPSRVKRFIGNLLFKYRKRK